MGAALQALDAVPVQLAHAFAAYIQSHGYLVHRVGVRLADAVVEFQHTGFVLWNVGEELRHIGFERFLYQGGVGGRCRSVGQGVHHRHLLVNQRRRVERDRFLGAVQQVVNLVAFRVEVFCQFFRRRRAPEFLFQLRGRLAYFRQQGLLVGGQRHHAPVLAEALQDRLAYPPHGVAAETVAAGFVEAPGGFDKPYVAGADKVGQFETLVLVGLGDADHKTHVAKHQAVEGLCVAGMDLAGEAHLVVDGKKRVL